MKLIYDHIIFPVCILWSLLPQAIRFPQRWILWLPLTPSPVPSTAHLWRSRYRPGCEFHPCSTQICHFSTLTVAYFDAKVQLSDVGCSLDEFGEVGHDVEPECLSNNLKLPLPGWRSACSNYHVIQRVKCDEVPILNWSQNVHALEGNPWPAVQYFLPQVRLSFKGDIVIRNFLHQKP